MLAAHEHGRGLLECFARYCVAGGVGKLEGWIYRALRYVSDQGLFSLLPEVDRHLAWNI